MRCGEAKNAHSTPDEAAIINLAWKVSAAVYQPNRAIADDAFVVEELLYTTPSLSGTVKGTTITLISQSSPEAVPNQFLPLVIVAMRGTASVVDRMVNANSQPQDASWLFVLTFFPFSFTFCAIAARTRADYEQINRKKALRGQQEKQ
jgi:hypothetical protein